MHTHHILIVDNDLAAATVTQYGLQRAFGDAAAIEIAPSPGVAWLRTNKEPIDLLIVDPSAWSHAATVLIKALHGEPTAVPVVVLTAYDTPRLRREMGSLGITHYLAKPVDLSELEAHVREALG
jgi:two-component system, OmpR family, response regulator